MLMLCSRQNILQSKSLLTIIFFHYYLFIYGDSMINGLCADENIRKQKKLSGVSFASHVVQIAMNCDAHNSIHHTITKELTGCSPTVIDIIHICVMFVDM